MPKLWSETIEAHRRTVHDTILDTTAALVAEHGLRSVTMTQIAEQTGIGRATLYKYFPDVEAIMRTWHERRIAGHLARLAAIRDRPGGARQRLAAVLEAYAVGRYRSHDRFDASLVAFLHRGDPHPHAQQQLHDLVKGLIAEGVTAGELREDIPPDELASYSLHALAAAGQLPSKAAVGRLVTLTIAGMTNPS